MPSPSAHTAVASLRTAYRRLWRSAIAASLAALGLLPLVYALPVPAWQRGVLAGGCVLYMGIKAYRLHTAWQAVRQLRLENCFIGHVFDGRQLRRCLRRRGHLWTHSHTVRALRRLMTRPLPNLLLTDKRRRRVRQEYRHTLGLVCPSRFNFGLPLAVLLVGGALASVAGGAGALAPWPLRLGLASALVLLGSEGTEAVFRFRARRVFKQLVEALAQWTLAHSVRNLLHTRQPAAYRHTPLYRAPAWFTPQPPGRPSAGSNAAGTSSSSRRRAA